jgi:hypothetical protein
MKKKVITAVKPEAPVKIMSDAYLAIVIVHNDGFTFSIPARGYNLKSWLAFEKKLDIAKSVNYHEITAAEHFILQYGPPEKIVVKKLAIKKSTAKKPVAKPSAVKPVKKPVAKVKSVKNPITKKPK